MKIPGLSAKYQDRVNHAIAMARKHGPSIVRGAKGSMYSVATGVVAWEVGKMLTEKSQTVKDNAYALPLIFAVAGHVGKKKQYDAGAGLLGVAGFLGRQAYEVEAQKKKDADAKAKLGGAVNAPAPAPGAGMVSGGEAGAVGRWQRVLDQERAQLGARGVSGGEAGGLVGGDPVRAPSPRSSRQQGVAELMGMVDY